jgi:hypothetical protein
MKESNGIERILLIITEALSADLEPNWIATLPYLGTQARQGFWAYIDPLAEIDSDDIWSSFSTGSTLHQAKGMPFWQVLEEFGKVVFTHGTLPFEELPIQTELGGLQQLVEQGDWHLLIAFFSRENLRARQDLSENIPVWEFLDREIESLALAAGSQTTLIVVALPNQDDERGLVLAGGHKIAPLGNPGPASLLDIAPTILWLLGTEVPASSNGRFLQDILKSDSDLTQDEMDLLTEHLRGLGYLG